MNCKPGDLAVIIKPSLRGPQLLGMIVTVLHAAPQRDFRLPDGFWQFNDSPGYWVIELPRLMEVPILLRGAPGTRPSRHGIAPDSAMRPIRNQPGADETLRWADRPEGVPA